MTTLLQSIGMIALFTLACWPAITSPANMARHYAEQCRHKQMFVAMKPVSGHVGRAYEPAPD